MLGLESLRFGGATRDGRCCARGAARAEELSQRSWASLPSAVGCSAHRFLSRKHQRMSSLTPCCVRACRRKDARACLRALAQRSLGPGAATRPPTDHHQLKTSALAQTQTLMRRRSKRLARLLLLGPCRVHARHATSYGEDAAQIDEVLWRREPQRHRTLARRRPHTDNNTSWGL